MDTLRPSLSFIVGSPLASVMRLIARRPIGQHNLNVDSARASALLEECADGHLSLSRLVGLGRSEIAAIERLGHAAFESTRFAQAAKIFAGLEALDAERPAHSFCLAHAELRSGNTEGALAALDRFLEHELATEDAIPALLMRASLRKTSDPDSASRDLEIVKVLTEGAAIRRGDS